ncbi:thioesterase [Hyaloscypha sp. PMI_1271]|nr:thioesterase [Hyaloscypha sp. PMI_1271]
MAAASILTAKNGFFTASTDVKILTTSHDDVTRELEEFINNHPMVIKLKSQSEFSKSRLHSHISDSERWHEFIGRTLMGPGKIVVSPFTWIETGGKSLVQILYLGMDLCGHPGIIHGGMLATILDEGFANCCSATFPNKKGMTANLNINYRAPVFASNFVVLRANTTKMQGRKIWVEGHIETLVTEGEKPVVLVEASGLFIELRQSATQPE